MVYTTFSTSNILQKALITYANFRAIQAHLQKLYTSRRTAVLQIVQLLENPFFSKLNDTNISVLTPLQLLHVYCYA